VRVTCAGRTDRGVHARAQVVHFDTGGERPDSAWVRGVNALLPEAIAVLWSQRVSDDFHARYAARSRTTATCCSTARCVRARRAPCGLVSTRRWKWGPMREASVPLDREHDFSGVPSGRVPGEESGAHEHSITIEAGRREHRILMRANAWLQHMARNIVGTLVYVGKGQASAQWVKKILDSRNRATAAPTFGPEGLYLDAVEYEAHWNLPVAEPGEIGI
jgi:tRNA pseudouridine38-40 synthase